jgi:HEPN domain-containing protein
MLASVAVLRDIALMAKTKTPANAATDPYAIFVRAEDFRQTSIKLIKAMSATVGEIDMKYFVPQVVNSAFSSELFLKCLYFLDHKLPPPRSHELDQLFNSLKVLTQDSIKKGWRELMKLKPHAQYTPASHKGKDVFDLVERLREGSKAFEHYRYVFQLGAITYRIGDLPNVLHDICISLNPDWAKYDSDTRKALPRPK